MTATTPVYTHAMRLNARRVCGITLVRRIAVVKIAASTHDATARPINGPRAFSSIRVPTSLEVARVAGIPTIRARLTITRVLNGSSARVAWEGGDGPLPTAGG